MLAVIVVAQVLVMLFGSSPFGLVSLGPAEWALCVCLGASMIIVEVVLRVAITTSTRNSIGVSRWRILGKSAMGYRRVKLNVKTSYTSKLNMFKPLKLRQCTITYIATCLRVLKNRRNNCQSVS